MTPSGGAQRSLLRGLARAGVDFVVIGGHAVSAHGFERATRDVDVVYSLEAASCGRLAGLLAELGAEVVVADQPAPGGKITGTWLAGGGHFRFATELGPLDALSQVSGYDYGRLQAEAVRAALDDFELQICGYEALVAMKRATGRPQDTEDLRRLDEARGGGDESGSKP